MTPGRSVAWAAAALAVGVATGLGGGAKGVDFVALVAGAVATPQTRAAAETAGMSLAPDAAAIPGSSDSVTALVSLARAGEDAGLQWVVRFRMAPGGPRSDRTIAFYTNAGDRFIFRTGQTPMDVRMTGPIPPGTAVARDEQVLVGYDFLRLDITGAVRAIEKMIAARQHETLVLSAATDRIGNANAREVRNGFERLGINADDRRSFTGALPALAEFFQLASRTPGLRDILYEVVKKPSVFAMLRNAGDPGISIKFDDGRRFGSQPGIWKGAGADDLCGLVFEVSAFGSPVLNVCLFVVPPTPPLEASAGIVAAAAFPPDDPDKVLVFRVVASFAGAAATP